MRYSYIWLASLALATACTHDDPTPVISASFTISVSAEASQAISFQNTSQHAANYVWNFGDGITDKAANPSHIYAKSGTYQVTLRAYGTQKDSSSITQSLIVTDYNVLAHTATKIVGTYDYKLYRYTDFYPPLPYPGTYTYIGTGIITVVQTGPSTLLITTPTFPVTATYSASYLDPNSKPPGQATGPNITFSTNISEGGTAYFYTSGDSLLLTNSTHVGHYSHSIDYYRSRRRP